HCSNLQAWYENGYNTRLLHYNLAFSLLQRLAMAGDIRAKKVFKEEVIERYNTGINSVREYLRKKGYLENFTIEEFLSLIENENDRDIIEQLRETYPHFEQINGGLPILNKNLGIKRGRVSKVRLRGLKLTQIPECVRNLRCLEYLDLSYNLFDELPTWISEFRYLRKLRICDNHLKSLPEEIGNLKYLEWIQARNNKLVLLPEAIGEIESLKTLELYDNNLIALPESLCNLSNLESLNLRNNELKKLPELIGELKNLRVLDLEQNKIQTLPISITELENLEILVLADNEHYSSELLDWVSAESPFEMLVPAKKKEVIEKVAEALPPGAFTRRWAGYATTKTAYHLKNSTCGTFYLFIQRNGESEGEYSFDAFLCTDDRNEVEEMALNFPERWHIEEFFKNYQALG
ncbi:hypothetical protein LCGC14_2742450, partial [marine sediment metagenome]